MPSLNRPLFRLATVISNQINAFHHSQPLLELPNHSWQRCSDLVRQLRRAQLRGWHLAAGQLRIDLRFALGSFLSEATAIHARLPCAAAPDSGIRFQDIYQELVALEFEFDGVEFGASYLSITTEPIELAGVYLGPFEIRLDVRRLSNRESAPYRVIATDPHPAEARENVTHPHVMDEVLCEGDGRQAIRQALAQGRLLDFFTLVAGVLRNYNSESPFVALELWRGRTCSDCGSCVDEDECFSCYRCNDSVCSACEITCQRCEESCCSDCAADCGHCGSTYCSSCLTRCAECRATSCFSCLDDQERCPNCHEDESQEPDEREEDGVTVQPDGLGQVAVSA